MIGTKVIRHNVLLNEQIAMPLYEVVYNAAEPDEYEDTWLCNFGKAPELWLSYGAYENEHVARYIANNIHNGNIKVKTFKDD